MHASNAVCVGARGACRGAVALDALVTEAVWLPLEACARLASHLLGGCAAATQRAFASAGDALLTLDDADEMLRLQQRQADLRNVEAALARLCPEDPRRSERFELYAGGLELANGFGELTDVEEQRQRFARDFSTRSQRGLAGYNVHEEFFEALARVDGAAGIALGIDRLLMLTLEVDDIESTQALPWSST